jgi:hypothetical protein
MEASKKVIRPHKWDLFTDACVRCGVIKRRCQYRTDYTLLIKGYWMEYLVNGEWTTERPDCVSEQKN